MPILRYLAMTAAEFQESPDFPGHIGWMSCLFSPFGSGLTNLPRFLPPGALLILSDYTSFQGHDPERIAGQLSDCAEALDCAGVLLDFQRPGEPSLAALARKLVRSLPCPVAVSEGYGQALDCPVFLPPVMPSVPLSEYLLPWQGREIWLELALDGEVITLTENGADSVPLPRGGDFAEGFREEALHSHYRIDLAEDAAKFTLWRTGEDLEALLDEAEGMGVTAAVGLYQELHDFAAAKPHRMGIKG